LRKVIKMKLKWGKVPDAKFNKTQLDMGVKVEMEHTNNKSLAKQIAKGHLKGESPIYYTYLKKMEQKMNKDMKRKKK
jgi:hypothetical protein